MKKFINYIINIIRKPLFLRNKNSISIHSVIGRNCYLREVNIGRFSYIASGVYINRSNIGNYCSIAAGVKIGGTEHPWRWGSTSFAISLDQLIEGWTYIEDDVWIGSNAVLRQGITVGRGSVIGAGSVVLCDVPRYSIVAGVPAKIIKKRFSSKLEAQIINSRFWEYPPKKAKLILNEIEYDK